MWLPFFRVKGHAPEEASRLHCVVELDQKVETIIFNKSQFLTFLELPCVVWIGSKKRN